MTTALRLCLPLKKPKEEREGEILNSNFTMEKPGKHHHSQVKRSPIT